MKNILLSADGIVKVYSVPDVVADNLSEYCIEFCDKWIRTSPNVEKFFVEKIGMISYDEDDFIDYLNTFLFPDEPSVLVEVLKPAYELNWRPEKYKDTPWFNF